VLNDERDKCRQYEALNHPPQAGAHGRRQTPRPALGR
jgi:hypothetical protein